MQAYLYSCGETSVGGHLWDMIGYESFAMCVHEMSTPLGGIVLCEGHR